MSKKFITKRVLVTILAAAMALSATACGPGSDRNNSGNPERKEAAAIKEDNKTPDDATDEAEKTADDTSEASALKTEYPVTILTYGSDGSEIQTTYDKAPEKVMAVYQGCVETMLALGLEDHLAATEGLDNEVPVRPA